VPPGAPGRGLVVVTGASGFIGAELCAHFRRRGRPVLGLARRSAERMLPDLQVVGDLRNAGDATLDEAFAGAEAVVHLAGRAHVMRERASDPALAYRQANVEVTERLARAATRVGVARFVLASSVKVMGEETRRDRPFAIGDAPRPQDAYARSKLAAEHALQEVAAGTPMIPVVLRLPLVYGRRVPGNFARLVDAVLRRRPFPFGAIDNRRSLLYVRNLALAIDAALDTAAMPAGAYFVADSAPVSTPDLLRAIAEAWHVPLRMTRVPVWALELGASLLGRGDAIRRLTRSLEVDTGAFRAATGFETHYTLQRALARMAQVRPRGGPERSPGVRGATTRAP